MFSIDPNKIKPLIVIEIEQLENKRESLLHNEIQEPYLFIKRKNQIEGYVPIKNILSKGKNQIPSIESLIDEIIPLDNVSYFHKNISLPAIFQIIGEPFSLVNNENGELFGYIPREDVLAELFRKGDQNIDLLKVILTSIPMGIFVVDRDKKIVSYNESGLKMIKNSSENILYTKAEEIFRKEHIESVYQTGSTVLNQLQITGNMGVLVDYSPIFTHNHTVDGMVIIVQDLPMVEEMANEIEYIKDLNNDLNAILTSIYDEILVVNEKGELIRYSDTEISQFWGVELKSLLGKNIIDLERQGLFSPSVTRLVLEQKKKVSVVQETKSGKKILAVGKPVFNEDGVLSRIIIASRDITETSKLKKELRHMKEMTDQYKRELDTIKTKDLFYKKLIYCSTKMEQIMTQVKKIADFSSTVLIYGESGVGKEVIAQAIHQLGKRSKKPFLKLNCGAIPETLLESELFGYSKGAFTGADRNGKDGYFKQANEGVLFLDEIGEMPLHLQVKLLRVLQEQEVIPIGSTKPIKINVQIIAATNKNLEKMVERREFREDLFYRLNVIPIQVPPLRDRPEDIPLLAFHFVQQMNERYDKNFHLTPDALNLLEVYSWPGNIRELQNMIERLIVSADDEVIDAEFVNRFLLLGNDSKKSKPIVTRILPLQEALDSVEEQLILLAMKQYKTTTKAAKALGISQSSVSRKYQRILADLQVSNENVFLH
ncbi:sigma 54-interacting transcriptional regulator [Ferdinandcohnia quinoae]|uniref:HTH-type transcriptional regulatory protein TyrR n=1 Tax=Fredinandcohnia quinoae TaxID=2918902 RepID=A0AAW5DYP7_9BACI|nr:sigma 54-interacting transcriptional regulator [Fredinandcohnia sp. SECRCQ15]MCH1625771.1 sigma 54-interacting transcriptional regulator [Fredinandcohnia sp. SECRCQ15]